MDTPTTEPRELTAGDTWAWLKTLGDYPATSWTLTYKLASREHELTITCTASGSDHAANVTAANSANVKPGLYDYMGYVDDGAGTRYTVVRGQLTVKANPASVGAGHDPRSFNKRMVDAIEATMENRATPGQREMVQYALADRSVTFDTQDTRERLVSLLNQFKWQVANERDRERLARGLPNQRYIGVRGN